MGSSGRSLNPHRKISMSRYLDVFLIYRKKTAKEDVLKTSKKVLSEQFENVRSRGVLLADDITTYS